ncbi:MAG: hypothetical protein LW832_08695 [Parachlamydia sp.]|jgi:hypothetical protein|nr:hypothetical protein [Parachlamydia sp.]
MQKGHQLQFNCQKCHRPILFSIFEVEKNSLKGLHCPDCGLSYDFGDEDLLRQLRKFENLCRQIQLSEEILSNTCVGIYLGDKEITIPYRLLLTRLNSTLNLMLGDKPLAITFRIEPSEDMPALNLKF